MNFRVQPVINLASQKTCFRFLTGAGIILLLVLILIVKQFSRPLKNSLMINSMTEPVEISMGQTEQQVFQDSNLVKHGGGELTKEEVESGMLDISQDDPRLLNYIKKNHLTKPPVNKASVVRTVKNSENYTMEQEQVEMFVLNLLQNKTNGHFLECGANDGEFYSNTLALELKYNWTGILIEADPRPLKKLRKLGRNAWVANVCLSIEAEGRPKKIEMLRIDKMEGLSFIPGLLNFKRNEMDSYEFETQCFTLYSILKAVGVTEIDYFSLDIEGAELAVLKTIPWDLVTFKVLSIEVHPQYVEPVKEYMTQIGYKYVTFLKNGFSHDQIYVHGSLEL